MNMFGMTALTNDLNEVKEEGITFEDKQLSWDTAEHVKDVVEALKNQKVVHYLKLEGNTLGIDAAAAIADALQTHTEFRKALWRNMFTRRLKTEIPKALEHLGRGLQVANCQLAVLDLSHNALGPNGMVGLESLLRSRVCYTLQELHLENCGLGIEGGRMLSNALLDCHKSSTAAGRPLQLKVFVTGRNRLENAGAKSIAKIFSTIKTLEQITMPQNSIYHDGIKELAAGFKECLQLQTLNLNDNTLTHKGANYIAEALKSTPHLRELNLGDCLLKTNGAYVLAEALEQGHQQLESMDLSNNEIGSDGGLALVQALENKPHLKKLELNGNEFGKDGCERIKEVMVTAGKRDVLMSLADDDGEQDSDNENEHGEDDTDDEYVDEEEFSAEDEEEQEGAYSTEPDNQTIEEYDEDDAYHYGEEDDDAAYVTTDAFSTKNFINNSLSSSKSTSFFADTTQTATPTLVEDVCTAEIFCLSQTPCTLHQFETLPGDNKCNTLKDCIKLFTGDNYLLVLIFTALKCAHLSQSSNAALEVAKSLYRDILEHAVETKQERRVMNYLLKQLGLLRSEETFKSSYDQANCRLALHKALDGYKVPSEYLQNMLKAFLTEPTNDK